MHLLAPIRNSLAALLMAGVAQASSYTVVTPGDGDFTNGMLAADGVGNLYGISAPGGNGGGTLFELTAASAYASQIPLYTFATNTNPGTGGLYPEAGPTLAGGQIIGTLLDGGPYGAGTVYNLGTSAAISYLNLHAFPSPSVPKDGTFPDVGLTPGPFSRLYGTTDEGGRSGNGTVYAISSSFNTPYYAVIHSFGGAGDFSGIGSANLAVNSQGQLFGIALAGGANNLGGIYMLKHGTNGWQEQPIFSYASGTIPSGLANIAADGQGNIYSYVGIESDNEQTSAIIFRLSPPAQPGGAWVQTVIANLSLFNHGPFSVCNLTWNADGSGLVGVSGGGGKSGNGTIFSLTPHAMGTSWKLSIIHSFFGTKIDGGGPLSAPVQVGSTFYGGNSTNGAIYAATP